MSSATRAPATLDDLYRVEGKAELIGGRIVPLMPTGRKPNRVALRIVVSLNDFAEVLGEGEVDTDNMGFTVPELSSGRRSFSPDASYYRGAFPRNEMRFILAAPTFAVEVRGEGDYGGAAEAELAAKRADYFEAGTEVVWDVDTVMEVVRKYLPETPEVPVTFGRGEVADAEPAVPGAAAGRGSDLRVSLGLRGNCPPGPGILPVMRLGPAQDR
ncbi:Uma2 family endonuclease [Aquisphaera insulae]|uniref:Uma2 family endonuclease n=1 Tax=Aquisphaera insulae TaxID=2712864 RepID=UPI0013ED75B0|nr:Uma2 family endonuclease [Aquisphaera insulae]